MRESNQLNINRTCQISHFSCFTQDGVFILAAILNLDLHVISTYTGYTAPCTLSTADYFFGGVLICQSFFHMVPWFYCFHHGLVCYEDKRLMFASFLLKSQLFLIKGAAGCHVMPMIYSQESMHCVVF